MGYLTLSVIFAVAVSAHRRDDSYNMQPSHEPQKMCCKVENSRLISIIVYLNQFKDKCDNESSEFIKTRQKNLQNGTLPGVAGLLSNDIHKIICSTMCDLRESEALDEKGYIDAEKSSNLLEKAVPEGMLREAVLSSNEDCARFANITAQLTSNSMEKGLMCNTASIHYMKCLRDFVILKCPEDKTQHSKECQSFVKQAKLYYDKE